MPDPIPMTIRGEGSPREVRIEVEPFEGAIFIYLPDSPNDEGNPRIAIDLFDGQLRAFLWGERGTYSHIINLDTGKTEHDHSQEG